MNMDCPPTEVSPYAVVEPAVKSEYEFASNSWTRSHVRVSVAQQPFERGGMRFVFKLIEHTPSGPVQCVAKFFDGAVLEQHDAGPVTEQHYLDDVITQHTSSNLAEEFNTLAPPKPIHFVKPWVLDIAGRGFCTCEPMLTGEYLKHNNNLGDVLSTRHSPQAFSHFTYEVSDHQQVVCDLQGVGDWYTDPQIHTASRKGFGLGNFGAEGINNFLRSHTCNDLCHQMRLPHLVKGVRLDDDWELPADIPLKTPTRHPVHNNDDEIHDYLPDYTHDDEPFIKYSPYARDYNDEVPSVAHSQAPTPQRSPRRERHDNEPSPSRRFSRPRVSPRRLVFARHLEGDLYSSREYSPARSNDVWSADSTPKQDPYGSQDWSHRNLKDLGYTDEYDEFSSQYAPARGVPRVPQHLSFAEEFVV
eukprot:CAMPEP_0114558116 /NCGR_PEP_ID=MMETSP0114-20121206/10199_1 /TAXON_ID=31324 /ORGANISM="Goniomonas sp, Strain m" /LENGTH=414 /DNA_ID=CAMNT_0001743463 /DNA_START=90 /DNA_END=1334 /DNA_ORIENTATION=+